MIKIAEETYRLANQSGNLNVYLTWCNLKEYNIHGTIKRDTEGIRDVSNFLNKSMSTTRSHLTKLVKLGFIKRNKYSYSLVSYDKCWEILGLKLTKNKDKSRLGNFIIFKVNSRENLKETIELREIEINTSRQAYQARKSILKDSEQFSDTEKNALKQCRFIDLPQFLDDLYVKRLSVLKNVKGFLESTDVLKYCQAKGRDFSYTKITPFLTCERTSVILGYEPSPKTGQNIRKRIQKAGLALFITREVELLETYAWNDAVTGYKLSQKYPDRLREKGLRLTHRLISKMVIL